MNQDIIQFLRRKDFKFIKKLGNGAVGVTYLLEDETIETLFVCKKYAPYDEKYKDMFFENFIREIKLLHLLYHKNIVRIFNHYLYPESKTGYIIMEYIDGNEIDTYIKINPDKINDLFKQTIEGFTYLEEAKILHRDIRPKNIMVSSEGIVKIIDFGFGKMVDFGENPDKSITLNWFGSIPDEFMEHKYDTQTEIYFVGKLFEHLIQINKIDIFIYKDVLKDMVSISPQNRQKSFFDISRNMIEEDEQEIEFEEEEREYYLEFMKKLEWGLATIDPEARYITSIEQIITSIKKVHKNYKLERLLIDTSEIIECFIEGGYSFFYSKLLIKDIKNFLNLLNNSSIENKIIIMNHVWRRLNKIPRESTRKPNTFDDDLPF